MSLGQSVGKWWQNTGKQVFPWVDKFARKVLSDARRTVGSRIETAAKNMWLRNNGLRTEFRNATGDAVSKPRVFPAATTKSEAAKQITSKTKQPARTVKVAANKKIRR